MNKEVVSFKEDVFLVKNFLDIEKCNNIINYLEWSAEVQLGGIKWNQISFYDSYAMGFWESDNNLLNFNLDPLFFNELKNNIKNAGEELFKRELREVSYHAQKWLEGGFASFHSDNSDEDGNPTAFEKSKYAAFIYLNDNFSGGKLNFKNYDISIIPETGSLAFFKGGHGNEHEVTKVIGGTRYTVGSFWDNADSVYTQEQKEQWEKELKMVRAEQENMYKIWNEDKKRGIFPDYEGKA